MKIRGIIILSVLMLSANGFAADSVPAYARIPRGTFMMGSPASEVGRGSIEVLHSVTLTHDFEIGTMAVTQLEWFQVMGDNPSYFRSSLNCPYDHKVVKGIPLCPSNPVEQVSWNDTQAFIRKINASSHDGYTYRLPTEAEWEYAARAGTATAYSFGNDTYLLDQYGWWGGGYATNQQTHPVADKAPNAFGLYEVHGNVWQWVQDWYGRYPNGAVSDPTGPTSGWSRVYRGGSWSSDGAHCRSAGRYSVGPDYRGPLLGFRLVRTR
jgi:formylglycine-generating enzyme required for sulfatase activity